MDARAAGLYQASQTAAGQRAVLMILSTGLVRALVHDDVCQTIHAHF